MAPPPRPPPELMDDAVAEILLRIPPDEPAHLVRASLVCKPWSRILSDRAFLRLYRAFHRTPPMLGYIQNSPCLDESVQRFVPTSVAPRFFIPPPGWIALDCRHGRALFLSSDPAFLVVWDPILGTRAKLPNPAYLHEYTCYSAAVLCTSDGCDHDHLDCRSGPFLVVYAGTSMADVTCVSVYSSETRAWSASTSIRLNSCILGRGQPSVLIRDALYFMPLVGNYILKYDLTGRIPSVVNLPDSYPRLSDILVAANDGGLGYARINIHGTLFLWSWKAGPDGIAGWVQHSVIRLLASLPTSPWFSLVGFAEGTDTILISTAVGIVTIKLKSGQAKLVGASSFSSVFPYMSFYTPDLMGTRLPAS